MQEPSSTVYYHTEDVHNISAAEQVVPIIMEKLRPKSLLDVGCGIGTWLSVFVGSGVQDVIGLDGDHVDRSLLSKFMTIDNFVAIDLSKPFDLGRRFDLVLSLEVAEHLPESAAVSFVQSLTRHSDRVLFSAAIPYQLGQNHINEQWQSYWIRLFSQFGYEANDCIRPLICNNKSVDIWYRQNMILFTAGETSSPQTGIMDFVLPDLWIQQNKRLEAAEGQLRRIREGKVGLWFYMKLLIRSVLRGGRKV